MESSGPVFETMESSLRGHAANFQQQQLVQRQNQMYQQQQQYRRQGHASQDQMSVGSHYSRDSATSASSQMDEAYRRLGRRLSARAHGDGPISRPQRLSRIGSGPVSSFHSCAETDNTMQRNASAVIEDRNTGLGTGSCGTKSGSTTMDRTAKVAKTWYSDHGDHHLHHKTPPRRGNLVRRMTINATDLFRLWQGDDSRRSKKRSSPKNDLDGSGVPLDLQKTKTQQTESLLGGALMANGVGLSAVMETSSSRTSSQSNTPSSRLDNSVKSRESLTRKAEDAPSLKSYARGKCLTQPSQPASNNGLDNAEGNLIVHENDSISVSRKQIHVLTKDKMNVKRADFRIQGLLGQGTFAQVFQCVHVQTGSLVAIKVVKNKPAYTRQAAVEIDIFRALVKGKPENQESAAPSESFHGEAHSSEHMVDLICYFMHQNHLCLVFELLGLNLYEVLKKRQFRGLPLSVVRHLVKQAVIGLKELAKRNIVHCDLKPENILLVSDGDVDSVVSAGETRRFGAKGSLNEKSRPLTKKEKQQTQSEPPLKVDQDSISQSLENSVGTHLSSLASLAPVSSLTHQNIKLIDFGSACFEGQTAHTYIQSRFYRSPEVLVGLPYDSAIDMWSLGCVAAELFLGLPILPGVHEHDQLNRICEMISKPSDWMLDQGTKASNFFVKHMQSTDDPPGNTLPEWRVRTQQEYIESLSETEIRKKGGLAKLEKQVTNRYFKRKRLSEIVVHKGLSGAPEDKDTLDLFVHFLYGILDPDPWKRWTAQQAARHPFLTGVSFVRHDCKEKQAKFTKDENQANLLCGIHWEAPWDPNICRRKLLGVQKIREKQQEIRRGLQRERRTPTRPPSTGSQDSSRMEIPNKTGPSPPSQVHRNQHGHVATISNQHARPSQLSSSYSHHASSLSGGAGLGGGDGASLASGQNSYHTGPMSYTDAGHVSNFLRNTMNEVDFASALQRPGVVPMEDSIASSIDRSGTGMPLYQQQQVYGSYNTNRSYQNRTHNAAGKASRPYGEDVSASGLGLGNVVGSAPSESLRAMPAEAVLRQKSSHVHSAENQQASGGLNQYLSSSLGQQFQNVQQSQAPGDSLTQQVLLMQALEDPAIHAQLRQDAAAVLANSLQQQFTYGNGQVNAQVYLQQQHAALQQQQMLLQQQQAALALQQQQLQTYGFTPQNAGNGSTHGLPSDQFSGQYHGSMGPPGMVNNGYYWVQSTDGTPVLVSAHDLSNIQGYSNGQQNDVTGQGAYPKGHGHYPYGGG